MWLLPRATHKEGSPADCILYFQEKSIAFWVLSVSNMPDGKAMPEMVNVRAIRLGLAAWRNDVCLHAFVTRKVENVMMHTYVVGFIGILDWFQVCMKLLGYGEGGGGGKKDSLPKGGCN